MQSSITILKAGKSYRTAHATIHNTFIQTHTHIHTPHHHDSSLHVSSPVISFLIILCHLLTSLSHIIPFLIISRHIVSQHIISQYIISHHIVSYPLISLLRFHSYHLFCLTVHPYLLFHYHDISVNTVQYSTVQYSTVQYIHTHTHTHLLFGVILLSYCVVLYTYFAPLLNCFLLSTAIFPTYNYCN